jgi:hypothetical protein
MKDTAAKSTEPKLDVSLKPAQESDLIKNLKRIVEKYDNYRMEAARHMQLLKDAEVEEKKLIEGADPDDAGQLRTISEMRIRKEMLSNKIQQFNTAANEGLDDLGVECDKLISDLINVLDNKWSECVCLIEAGLRQLFGGRELFAMEAAQEICNKTNFYSQYHQLYNYLRSEGLRAKLPIFKVKALLATFDQVNDLTPNTIRNGNIWETKTTEKAQDEELALLLTADGKEERILIIMNGGMNSREVAEKAADGRIKFLQAEQERRGIAVR